MRPAGSVSAAERPVWGHNADLAPSAHGIWT